jgi:hypothetical protein
MKKILLRIGVLVLFLSIHAEMNANIPPHSPFEPVSNFLDKEFPFFYKKQTVDISDEELIQTMKNALNTIYDEKKMDFNSFNVDKSGSEITLTGAGEFYKEDITLTSAFSTSGKILSFTGQFKPNTELSRRNFKKISNGQSANDWFPKAIQKNIAVDNISLSFDENTQKPSEIAIAVTTAKSWDLLKGGAMRLNNITGTLAIQNPTSSKSATASLEGDFKIASSSIKIGANIGSSREDWSFTGELSNYSITDVIKGVVGSVAGLPMPDGFVDASIVKSSFMVAPAANRFSLSGTGAVAGQDLGDVQMLIEPKDGGRRSKDLSFMVGIAPSPDFKMAKIDASLKILDDVGITNFGLVLASDAAASSNLAVFKKLGEKTSIGRGLNFIGAFDLRPVNMDKLIGLNTIMLRAVVSNRPSDLLLEASLNTTIKMSNAATFKRILFKLKPAPSNFEISMGGEMEVKVDKDLLTFNATVGVDVTDQALFVSGAMKGTWNQPFGAKGLSIADLWMRFGVSFKATPIPLPELGIAGKLKANSFEGDLMVVINTNNPTQSALDVGFNEIDLKAILENYCNKQTLNKIPAGIRNTVLNVSMKDVRLTVVPRPMTINDVSYDAGFRAKGTASIANMGAMLDVTIGYDGIDAKAEVDKISHPPFFELKGARGKEKPSIHIVAKASTESKVAVSGSATLLGVTSETDLLINDKGFDLYMKGKVFNAFQASFEVSGSRVTDGGSFRVAATMEQDFLKYFTKHASEEVDKATKKTQSDITKAQNTITREQKKVAKLDIQIKKQRNIVKQERARDLANLKAAQAKVAAARREVQTVQNNINAAHKAIAAAKKRIKKKEDWVNAGNVFEKVSRGLEATPYFAEQGLIISGKAAEIAALETAKATADGTLYLAEKSVEGIHYIGDKVPVDADVRVAGLIVSKETAIGLMEGAKYVLEGGKIIGVGTLSAAKWIVENGVAGVVNVNYAHFEGKLSGAHGGSVTLHVKGVFADKPFDKRVTFNFKNPFDEVVKFADNLL